jgi:hypothetical protein
MSKDITEETFPSEKNIERLTGTKRTSGLEEERKFALSLDFGKVNSSLARCQYCYYITADKNVQHDFLNKKQKKTDEYFHKSVILSKDKAEDYLLTSGRNVIRSKMGLLSVENEAILSELIEIKNEAILSELVAVKNKLVDLEEKIVELRGCIYLFFVCFIFTCVDCAYKPAVADAEYNLEVPPVSG